MVQTSEYSHTVELRQLTELVHRLAGHGPQIAAGQLGLAPETALLSGLHWSGPPQFPYIYGDFRLPSSAEVTTLNLHSDQLRSLSRLAGLHHVWGV